MKVTLKKMAQDREQIYSTVCENFGIDRKQLVYKYRHAHLVRARRVLIASLWSIGYPLLHIARHLERNHATIIHAKDTFVQNANLDDIRIFVECIRKSQLLKKEPIEFFLSGFERAIPLMDNSSALAVHGYCHQIKQMLGTTTLEGSSASGSMRSTSTPNAGIATDSWRATDKDTAKELSDVMEARLLSIFKKKPKKRQSSQPSTTRS